MELGVSGTLLLAVLISLILYFFTWRRNLKKKNLPPGPPPLPILGTLLHMSTKEMSQSLMKLSETYGPVFTIYLSSAPAVVLVGYDCVKEALIDNGDMFSLRRFSLTTLRNFGMGKRSIEERIQEEARYLAEEIKKNGGTPFDPTYLLTLAVSNVICSIMFGDRCEYEDTDITTVLTCIYETFLTASTIWGQIYDMFPGLMKFIPGKHQKIYKSLDRLHQFVNEKVIINQKTLDPNNPRDFVDAFLIKMEKEKVNPNSEFNMKNLLACTLQIFFAGVETTSTTITYSLLIFLKYPDVLAKVHKEIDQVIGRIRSPSIEDRNHMPYTDAVMHELQRFTDLLPMGVPRKTTKKVEFNGYTLPKDIDVFPLLTTVLKDPTCFKYPKEFNPENFLNEKGKFQKNAAFMPLAAGKRICLGEALVRVELFLFLITILQNFDLKSPIPIEDLDINPNTSGLGNIPKPYKIAFIPR
uniref:Cytochrome P450 44476 n=1 Tax=Bufo gargarizans TaxID=30331 RepID=A0A977JB80_BUFGR|nr:cytochrome P450 44476 [Bufo gargarizans]